MSNLIICFFSVFVVVSAAANQSFDGQHIYSDSLKPDSIYSPEDLMLMQLPEICPPLDLTMEIYCPEFIMRSDYYKNRYQERDLMHKIVNNKGNGFNDLYGTRNLRPILHGVAYRGGANNYYHKKNKRKNSNPMQKDGIINLCSEGFSSAIYLYRKNWDPTLSSISCKCINNTKNEFSYAQLDYFDKQDLYNIVKLVYESANDDEIGPIYLHCWNGWHASGFISAVILKQFCNFSDIDAVSYWDLGTDGANTSPRYNSIREKIKAFKPYPEFYLIDSLGNKLCPPMPEFIDSSKLHISLEHLFIVPEALPLGTVLILNNIKFSPYKTSFAQPLKNEDLNTLLKALNKSPDISLELSGHTDRSGDEKINKELSFERAKFIFDFLINNGVEPKRLTVKGYGSTKPAYSNRTKDGRSANRRIEIKIISKKAELMDVLVEENYNNNIIKIGSLPLINSGQSLVLTAVIFQPNETILSESALLQIDSLFNIMSVNHNLVIEIMGYSDISGIEEKNLTLSIIRAKEVYDYLISKGINEKRLFYSGCGSTNPIAPNKFEWGRNLNRRIEVVLLSK